MKNIIAEYLTDSFIDYAGKEHKLVACALSMAPEASKFQEAGFSWNTEDGYDDVCVCRIVTLGIAVCNPEDLFDEEKGKRIAYNKALHNNELPKLVSVTKGIINKTLIQALLKQELDFVKGNPERVIAGYHESKVRFNKRIALDKEFMELSEEEKVIIDKYMSGVDVQKCVQIAQKLLDRRSGETSESC